jgi:hypothetical protein
MFGFIRFESQCLPVDTRGTCTCFEKFSKNSPCLHRRQEITSRYLGGTPAKEEENSPLLGLSLADSDEAGTRRGLTALDTDKAIREAKTNPQSVTVSTKVNDSGMFGSTV